MVLILLIVLEDNDHDVFYFGFAFVRAIAPKLQDFDTILKLAHVPIFAIQIDCTITRFSPTIGVYVTFTYTCSVAQEMQGTCGNLVLLANTSVLRLTDQRLQQRT